MLGRKDKTVLAPPPTSTAALETTIGPNTYFKGNIQSDGGVRVQGIFEGTVDITGNLIIAEGAKVIAEVKANNVLISGAIKGNIDGNVVQILKTGRMWGNLMINSLTIEEGAYLRGQTTMHSDIEPPMIEAPRPKSAAKAPEPQPAARPASATIVDVEPRVQGRPREE
jgi:cytoskeletal protein CcmA (bactofilin family)